MFKTKKITRFLIFAAALFYLVACHQSHYRSTSYSYVQPTQLDDGLPVAPMYNEGMDTGKIVTLTKQILADTFTNIHSMLICRHGKLIYENYFAGEDGDAGYVNHTIDDLHDCRSVSKSFTSACIGIAVKQGLIKSIDEPIFSYLREYEKYFDSAKRKITIRNLLTMTSGLEWDEKITYLDHKNTEIQMDGSDDPISFILSRKLTSTPGTVWNYSAASAQLLGEIIRKVTGERLDIYAGKNLFAPLGIEKYTWWSMPKNKNMTAAAWGLRLRSRDLAKFGLLYMNNGRWGNTQVLDSDWVNQSLSFQVSRSTVNPNIPSGYGFQFWTDQVVVYQHETDIHKYKTDVPYARGNGGQYIYFWRDMDILVVFTGGNYDMIIKKENSADDALGVIVTSVAEMKPYLK